VRIEENLIRPEDTLFVAGTLTENPGVEVRPFSSRSDGLTNLVEAKFVGPEIIRLQSGAAPTTQEMGPVSYTHLDVYKRQGHSCPLPLTLTLLDRRTTYHRHLSAHRRAD